jgi:hypothetical protein
LPRINEPSIQPALSESFLDDQGTSTARGLEDLPIRTIVHSSAHPRSVRKREPDWQPSVDRHVLSSKDVGSVEHLILSIGADPKRIELEDDATQCVDVVGLDRVIAGGNQRGVLPLVR